MLFSRRERVAQWETFFILDLSSGATVSLTEERGVMFGGRRSKPRFSRSARRRFYLMEESTGKMEFAAETWLFSISQRRRWSTIELHAFRNIDCCSGYDAIAKVRLSVRVCPVFMAKERILDLGAWWLIGSPTSAVR